MRAWQWNIDIIKATLKNKDGKFDILQFYIELLGFTIYAKDCGKDGKCETPKSGFDNIFPKQMTGNPDWQGAPADNQVRIGLLSAE